MLASNESTVSGVTSISPEKSKCCQLPAVNSPSAVHVKICDDEPKFSSPKRKIPKKSQLSKKSHFGLKRNPDLQHAFATYILERDSPGPCYDVGGRALDFIRKTSCTPRFGRTEKPDIWFPFKNQLMVPGPCKYSPTTDTTVRGGRWPHLSHASYHDEMLSQSISPGPKYYPQIPDSSGGCVIGCSKGHDVNEFFIPKEVTDSSVHFDCDLAKAMDFIMPRSAAVRIFNGDLGLSGSRKDKVGTPGPGHYDPPISGAIGNSGARISSSVLERLHLAQDGYNKKYTLDRAKGRMRVRIPPQGSRPAGNWQMASVKV